VRHGVRAATAVGLVLLLAACGGEQATRRSEFRGRGTFECPRDKNLDDRQAARVGEKALPQVWAVLEELNHRDCWASALAVAGMAGTAESVARLRTFIESQAPLFAMSEDMFLLQQAYMALGQVVRFEKHARPAQEALDYLIESTEPLNWVKRSIDWNIDSVMRRELIRTITMAATSALAVTRRKEAREHLLQMAQDSAERRTFRFKFHTTQDEQDAVESLINLHVLPPGRVVFAMGETLLRLKDIGDDKVRELVERVRDAGWEAWKLEREWLAKRRNQEGFDRAVKQANAVADARLSGFHGQLESLVHLMDTAEAKKGIAAIEQVTFPQGPLTLINSEHGDQVRTALERMAVVKERYGEAVALLRLGSHVETVIEAHEAFKRALESGESGAGFERVINARSALQNSLRVLLATVVARYPGWNEGDREKRSALLQATLNQNEQVDSYLRRRVPVRDTNPETGQELAPLKEGGGTTQQGRPDTPNGGE
jgi:hypothetical protein